MLNPRTTGLETKPRTIITCCTPRTTYTTINYAISHDAETDTWACSSMTVVGELSARELPERLKDYGIVEEMSLSEFEEAVCSLCKDADKESNAPEEENAAEGMRTSHVKDITPHSQFMTYKVKAYDSGKQINRFTYKGCTDWWDKSTRQSILLRAQTEKPKLWVGGKLFSGITGRDIGRLVVKLETYATQCYDTTQETLLAIHEAASVEQLKEIEETFKARYPQPIEM